MSTVSPDLAQILADGLKMFHVKHFEKNLDKSRIFLDELKNWNQKFNLTGLKDNQEIIIKHFLDSLSLAQFADFSRPVSLLDIGTGAGFPGLLLSIYFPEIKVTLIESSQKKIKFLEHLATQLLGNGNHVQILLGRAEDLIKTRPGLAENFDLATARAVGPLEKVIFWVLPFLKVKGIYLAQAGPQEARHLQKYQEILKAVKAELTDVFRFTLPFSNYQRIVLKIKKCGSTPQLSKSARRQILQKSS